MPRENPIVRQLKFRTLSRSLSSIEESELSLLTKDEQEEFFNVYKTILKDLTDEDTELGDIRETQEWLAKVLDYNVPHGKRTRGLATSLAFRHFAKDPISPEDIKLSCILGWTTEFLQAFYLITDDIMDESETRRGQPCWYKYENMGNIAFNDALLIESSLYIILRKYFRNKEYYVNLLDIFHDVSHKTTCGQSLDTLTGIKKEIDKYTMERYRSIVKYKTSFYSFYLPAALGMAMANVTDPLLLQQVREFTLDLGHFFQIQDDYLDCFGDPSVTGKIGTDIQDAKCSWIFVTALQKANGTQKQVLLDNYGKHESNHVNKVKEVYNELKLEEIYKQFEKDSYATLLKKIKDMDSSLPKKYFLTLLTTIYGRKL